MISSIKHTLVLVNTWRMTNAKGGTEKVLSLMANTFCEKNYNVYVLYYDPVKGNVGFTISDKVHVLNAFEEKNSYLDKIKYFHFIKRIRHLRRLKFQASKIASSFKKQIDKIKADLYISFTPEATYVLRDLLKVDTPIITMFHFDPIYFFNQDSFRCIYKSAVEKSTAIQVLIPEFEKTIQKEFPNTYTVTIPNVVPQASYQADTTKHKVICVGRICPHKRQLLLLEAFIKVSNAFPDWTLEFWGEEYLDIEYTKKIKLRILDNKLENRIQLCGTTDDIEQKLIASSIFVLPSLSEAFSLALTEAMAVGLPVIVTNNCTFMKSMVKNNHNGLLCNDTVEDLSATLEYLMKRADKRIEYGANAKIDISAFTKEIVYGKWETLINKILTQT